MCSRVEKTTPMAELNEAATDSETLNLFRFTFWLNDGEIVLVPLKEIEGA